MLAIKNQRFSQKKLTKVNLQLMFYSKLPKEGYRRAIWSLFVKLTLHTIKNIAEKFRSDMQLQFGS